MSVGGVLVVEVRHEAVHRVLVWRMGPVRRDGRRHRRLARAHELAVARGLAAGPRRLWVSLGLRLLGVRRAVRLELPDLPLVRALGQILKVWVSRAHVPIMPLSRLRSFSSSFFSHASFSSIV